MTLPAALAARARQLRWVLFDVDGVLTDGRLTYSAEGEALKTFDVKDGLGLKLAQRHGLGVGLLSARDSAALRRRARELDLDEVLLNRSEKATTFTHFLERHTLSAEAVAYVGDDLVDLPVLLACGLSFAPADAVPEVRSRVDRVLGSPGGAGAVREVVELLLTARGDWEAAVGAFLSGS